MRPSTTAQPPTKRVAVNISDDSARFLFMGAAVLISPNAKLTRERCVSTASQVERRVRRKFHIGTCPVGS